MSVWPKGDERNVRAWDEPVQLALPGTAEIAPATGSLASLAECLARPMTDSRHPRGYRLTATPVPLVATALLLVLARLRGLDGYRPVAAFGARLGRECPEVWDVLGFVPAGRERPTPCITPVFRVLRGRTPAEVAAAVGEWIQAVVLALRAAGDLRAVVVAGALAQVALDGKTVCAAAQRREDAEADGLPIVTASLPAMHAVIDGVETGGTGQELAAALTLLGRLPLTGRIVTGDALLTQRNGCQTNLDGGGAYLFPVDANQPTRLEEIQTAFSPGAPADDVRRDRAQLEHGGTGDVAGTPRCSG